MKSVQVQAESLMGTGGGGALHSVWIYNVVDMTDMTGCQTVSQKLTITINSTETIVSV